MSEQPKRGETWLAQYGHHHYLTICDGPAEKLVTVQIARLDGSAHLQLTPRQALEASACLLAFAVRCAQ